MTLNDAIIDYEKMAKHQKRLKKQNTNHGGTEYIKMACLNDKKVQEYFQLAEWLRELKELKEQQSEDVISRYDVPHKIAEFFSNWDGDENTKMEISVSDMREISSMFISKCRVESKLETLEQQSEDAISRKETFQFLENHSNSFEDVKIRMAFRVASSLVNNPYNLPCVQPKPKTGRWIGNHTTCDCCGWQMIDDVMESPNMVFFPFCPNCGAEMIEPQESEKTDADSD